MNSLDKKILVYVMTTAFWGAGALNTRTVPKDTIYNPGEKYTAEKMTLEDFRLEQELTSLYHNYSMLKKGVDEK